MYDTFQTISYPFVEIFEPISYERGKALKSSLVDFRLNVYSDIAAGVPVVEVTSINGTSAAISFNVQVTDSKNSAIIARGTFTFQNDGYATQDFIRYHFDNTDLTVTAGYSVEGYFCFNRLSDLISAFADAEYGAVLKMEPTTVALFSRHRVNDFYCRSAKPLLTQTSQSRYVEDNNPVTGDVKFVAGHNCSISVQSSTKTIIVSAQRNANDSDTERCGVWANKVSPKDILCNEVIYSISGITPDEQGNVKFDAVTPLVCSSLTASEVAQNNPQLASSLSAFPSIIRCIYVGFPQSQGNSSVFNCA